jgi:hypothetical protein
VLQLGLLRAALLYEKQSCVLQLGLVLQLVLLRAAAWSVLRAALLSEKQSCVLRATAWSAACRSLVCCVLQLGLLRAAA